jgi:hypothetical protein
MDIVPSTLNPNIRSFRAAQQDAQTVIQNGDYIFDLAKPMIMDYGDTFTIKQMFVDTQKLNEETIVLEQDTEATLVFIYFEANTSFTDKTNTQGTATADNALYIMCHHDPGTGGGIVRSPVIGRQSVTLPAGSYTPDRLAQYLTDNFSETARMVNSNKLDPGNAFLYPTDRGTSGGGAKTLNNIDWGSDPYPYGSIAALSGPVNSWGPQRDDGQPFYLGDGTGEDGYPNDAYAGGWVSMGPGVEDGRTLADMGGSDYYITSTGTNGAGSGLVISVSDLGSYYFGWFGPNFRDGEAPDDGLKIYYGIVSEGTGYNRGDEVYFSSDQFAWLRYSGGSPSLTRCPAGGTLTLTVQSISDDGNSFNEFIKVGESISNPTNAYKYGDDDPYLVGASEVDLEYSDNNNGAYSWNYLHTPYYVKGGDAEPLQPAVKLQYDTTSGQWNTLDVDSGICLIDVLPKSLWSDVMNFDLNQLLLRDSNGQPITHVTNGIISSLTGYYTYGYLGLNGFLNQDTTTAARKIISQSQTIATTLTQPIEAGEFNVDTGSGYYIIEVEGFHKQEMVLGESVIQASAILSKQYNQQDVITGYVESSTPYIHYGSPQPISSFRVRIINPDTGMVDTTLGEDNTLFMQLTPNPEIQNLKKKTN